MRTIKTEKTFSLGGAQHGIRCVTAWWLLIVAGALLCFQQCSDNPASVPKSLSLHARGDTVVSVHDSLRIYLTVPDAAARGVGFRWFIDTPHRIDSVSDSIITTVFSIADTGKHCLVVKAIDKDGIVSAPDTFWFTVTYSRPVVTLFADSLVSIGASYTVRFVVVDADHRIAYYSWYIDNLSNSRVSTDTVVSWAWNIADTGMHRIIARAVDRDSVRSYPCSLAVRVTYSRPAVTLYADSLVSVGAPFTVRFVGVDADHQIAYYSWYIDNANNSRVSMDTVVTWAWNIADTGVHRIIARAVDRDSVRSYPCSLAVRVTYNRPAVRLNGNAIAYVGAPYSVHLSSTDAANRIAGYIWYVDDSLKYRAAADTILVLSWTLADTGRHVVGAWAINRDSVRSYPDSLVVQVKYLRPIVTPLPDRSVKIHDTLVLHLSASDPISHVVKYRYYFDNPALSVTTSDTVVKRIWSVADTGRHRFMVTAINADSIESYSDLSYINVTYSRPKVLHPSDTIVKVNDTLVLHFTAYDQITPIIGYRYFIDDAKAWIATGDSIVRTVWHVADSGSHVFVVEAINKDSIASLPDTFHVAVTYERPQVTLRADTLAAITDTVKLTAHASDGDGRIDHYLWSIDGLGSQWLATPDSSLHWLFGGIGESFHTVRVIAVDNDGFASGADSVRIHITLNRPQVRLPAKDTAMYANQDLKLKATVVSTIRPIAQYRWMVDGRLQPQSITSDTITLRWSASAAGAHLVSLTVKNSDSVESLPDTMLVRVSSGSITIAPLRDTTILSRDTLKIVCKATSDNPGSTIVKYLWGFSGAAVWDDSTILPNHALAYSGKGAVRVSVGARDNMGLLAMATFTVTFNRPPDSVVVRTPRNGDTLLLSQRAPTCTVPFSFSASDPDNDSIVYSLSWGPAADSMVQVYQGKNQSSAITVTRPGQYFWNVSARDPFGQTRTANGTVTAIREYRICFVGHSIIVGMMGDGISGGFRGGVLDSLRKTLGKYERLKVVGPYTSPFMSRSKVDDSCMAISGTTAPEIYLMLYYDWPQLAADIWVLMIGVNDAYSGTELRYSSMLMDVMISRNPAGRLYVLNGTPLTPEMVVHNANLPYFNIAIADSIRVRDSVATLGTKKSHVFQVDAFTAVTKNNGQLDSTLIADNVHPNQKGYNKLRDAIFTVMKKSIPPAILKNP
jgi:lysophospholipase L1-like esterase